MHWASHLLRTQSIIGDDAYDRLASVRKTAFTAPWTAEPSWPLAGSPVVRHPAERGIPFVARERPREPNGTLPAAG